MPADVIDPPLEPVERYTYGAGVFDHRPATGHTFRGEVPGAGRVALAVEPGELMVGEVWYRGELDELLRVPAYAGARLAVNGGRCDVEVPAHLAGRPFVITVVTAQPVDDQPPPPTTARRVDTPATLAPVLELDSRVGWHRARVQVWPDRLVLRRRYWLPACGRYSTVAVPFDEVRLLERAGTPAGWHDVVLHTGAGSVTVRTTSATAADRLARAVGR